MKVENTDKSPKFNLMEPDGVRSQGHAEDVTDVLLNDGNWYNIVRGSFKFYQTKRSDGGKGVPFVQFDVNGGLCRPVTGKRVEVFPASVCGLAYVADKDDE